MVRDRTCAASKCRYQGYKVPKSPARVYTRFYLVLAVGRRDSGSVPSTAGRTPVTKPSNFLQFRLDRDRRRRLSGFSLVPRLPFGTDGDIHGRFDGGHFLSAVSYRALLSVAGDGFHEQFVTSVPYPRQIPLLVLKLILRWDSARTFRSCAGRR